MDSTHPSTSARTVWTTGHSNRSIEDFLALLEAHGIRRLVDIRTAPGSRKHPHFNAGALERSLAERSIGYTWMKELGGFRKPRPDSPNSGWRNLPFRGYADNMLTEEFAAAARRASELASREPVAMMCSEAVPWRCHRSLLADYFTAILGFQVFDIQAPKRAAPHKMTPFAKVDSGRLTYPPEEQKLPFPE